MNADLFVVVPYDAIWPARFEAEHRRITAAVAPAQGEIIHVGSTSVPGLTAKPIIDILIGLEALGEAAHWIPALESLGYEYCPQFEDTMPERRYFRRFEAGVRTHHVHMVESTSHFWRRTVAVRDYLRAFPAEAEAYAALKREVTARSGGDRERYMDGKDAFVKALEARALVWTSRTEIA